MSRQTIASERNVPAPRCLSWSTTTIRDQGRADRTPVGARRAAGPAGPGASEETAMDSTTLLIVILIVLLVGGGGWYGRGRWF